MVLMVAAVVFDKPSFAPLTLVSRRVLIPSQFEVSAEPLALFLHEM